MTINLRTGDNVNYKGNDVIILASKLRESMVVIEYMEYLIPDLDNLEVSFDGEYSNMPVRWITQDDLTI